VGQADVFRGRAVAPPRNWSRPRFSEIGDRDCAELKIGSSLDRYTQTKLFLVVPEENYYVAVSSHDRY
jgi:hypothetical protein